MMYATIKNIKDILPLLDGKKEFLVKQCINEPSLTFIDYLVKKQDTFPNIAKDDSLEDINNKMIYRECRGIKFDTVTGEIKARPHVKFFNLNECVESQAHNINWQQNIFLMEKLDGSMITPYVNNTEKQSLHFHTTMGYTGIAENITATIKQQKIYENYYKFCDDCQKKNITPIFEFCGQEQRIVVDYKVNQLILTAIRDNYTGEYMNPIKLKSTADHYGLPCVKILEFNGLENLLNELHKSSNMEGYVIGFQNTKNNFISFIKVKCDWYVGIHKALENIGRESFVWNLILSHTVDDITPKLLQEAKKKLLEFNELFNKNLLDKALYYREICDHLAEKNLDKKHLALYLNSSNMFNQHERSIIFAYFNGIDPLESLTEIIKKNFNNSNKIETVRYLLGNIKWEYNIKEEKNVVDKFIEMKNNIFRKS